MKCSGLVNAEEWFDGFVCSKPHRDQSTENEVTGICGAQLPIEGNNPPDMDEALMEEGNRNEDPAQTSPSSNNERRSSRRASDPAATICTKGCCVIEANEAKKMDCGIYV